MSKQHVNPRTMAKAAKIAGFHCKEVEEMAKDIGRKMVKDQMEWLDSVMKDLLPPRLYEAGLHGDLTEEIEAYVNKHQIKIVFIPDTLRIRVMLGERPHAEFLPQLTVDGEPVSMKPVIPLDGSQN